LHCKEQALEAGRNQQSAETGFVHGSYHSHSRDTIPIEENFLFSLALLRSRLSENVQEAKRILERLLSYQVEGNFPIYLHEFPTCYNRYTSAEVLAPLYWILFGYHHVLGDSLKKKVESAALQAAEHCLKMMEESPADYTIALRIGCAVKALGNYRGDKTLFQKGDDLVESLEKMGIQPAWYASETLGHILASFNMDTVWPEFWAHCERFFHQGLSLYSGPHLSERQQGGVPESTLFACYLSERAPFPSKGQHLSLLQGALVHPLEKPTQKLSLPGSGVLCNRQWETFSADGYFCSLIEQDRLLETTEMRGFSPVYLVWGKSDSPQSLVFQGGNIESARFCRNGNQVEMWLTLGKESENDHPKEHQEVVAYCSRQDVRITVDQKAATLFRLGERLDIHSSLHTTLQFYLDEGEGDFAGHLLMGSRPSEGEESEKGTSIAHDWKIVLRSIRRSHPCTIRVRLSIDA
jgi:hypothetical protein